MIRPGWLVLLAGLLSSCAMSPDDCDPSKDGLLNSAGGILSGCFEKRQKADALRAQDEQAKTAALQKKNDELRSTSRDKKAQLEAVRERMAEIENEIPLLEKRVNDEAETAALEAELEKRRLELEKLERIEARLRSS